MTDRIPCAVPYCRRTRKPLDGRDTEWVCSIHWAMVSRSLKAEYRLARRRARRILRHKPAYALYWTLPPGSPARLSAVAMWRRIDSIWERCKIDAIEKAAGI